MTKNVSFHPDAKKHDGLTQINAVIDDITTLYFDKRVIRTKNDLLMYLFSVDLSEHEEDVCKTVCRHFSVLAEKTKLLNANEYIPVLAKGGGKGHQACSEHAVHFERLGTWLKELMC